MLYFKMDPENLLWVAGHYKLCSVDKELLRVGKNLLILCWVKVEKKWPSLKKLPSLHRSVRVVVSFTPLTQLLQINLVPYLWLTHVPTRNF